MVFEVRGRCIQLLIVLTMQIAIAPTERNNRNNRQHQHPHNDGNDNCLLFFTQTMYGNPPVPLGSVLEPSCALPNISSNSSSMRPWCDAQIRPNRNRNRNRNRSRKNANQKKPTQRERAQGTGVEEKFKEKDEEADGPRHSVTSALPTAFSMRSREACTKSSVSPRKTKTCVEPVLH